MLMMKWMKTLVLKCRDIEDYVESGVDEEIGNDIDE